MVDGRDDVGKGEGIKLRLKLTLDGWVVGTLVVGRRVGVLKVTTGRAGALEGIIVLFEVGCMEGTEDVGFMEGTTVGFTLEGSVVGFFVGPLDGVIVGILDVGRRVVSARVGDRETGRALEGTAELFVDGIREGVGRMEDEVGTMVLLCADGRADGTYCNGLREVDVLSVAPASCA